MVGAEPSLRMTQMARLFAAENVPELSPVILGEIRKMVSAALLSQTRAKTIPMADIRLLIPPKGVPMIVTGTSYILHSRADRCGRMAGRRGQQRKPIEITGESA